MYKKDNERAPLTNSINNNEIIALELRKILKNK